MKLAFRSSSLDQLFACNGSLLAQSFVIRPDGDEGLEGSLLHYLIAKRAFLELGAAAPDGLNAPEVRQGYTLPAFSAWIVDWGIEHIRQAIPLDWSLMVEVGVAYEFTLPRPLWIPVSELSEIDPTLKREVRDGVECVFVERIVLSGHLDVVAISPDGKRAIGLDWKTGIVGADPAESNWQASSYMTLCKRAWPEIESMEFQLCQPRIDPEATGIDRVTKTTLGGDELSRMGDVITERINAALENRYETNSGIKQCRYCAVAMRRPWDCPSLAGDAEFMKAMLTPEALARLRDNPDDGLLGDFVITGKTLTEPIKKAQELLHERIDASGYVDAACGTRITRTTRPGSYEIPDKKQFHARLCEVLPSEDDRAECASYSMEEVKKRIALHRKIPRTSKKGENADSVFDMELRPLTEQRESRILVFQ